MFACGPLSLQVFNNIHEDQGLLADCSLTCIWTEMNDHPASVRVTCGQHVEFPSHCWLYSYKSVVMQITHDAGLALNPLVENFSPTGDEANTESHSMNLKQLL